MTLSEIEQFLKRSLLAAIGIIALLNLSVQAQDAGTEVPLTFQYEGIISNYINSIYADDQFYLAGTEVLNVLAIPYELDQSQLLITGRLNGRDFRINLRSQTAQFGEEEILLTAADFRINELDYFLRPDLFLRLFDLNFEVDFNNLRLSLQAPYEVPRVAQFRRSQKRNQMERAEVQTQRAQYPLLYERDPRIVDGAFLDYNINGILTNNSTLMTMNNTIGTEFLFGDLQGSLFTVINQNDIRTQSSNLRLRYVSRNTPWFSTALLGQSNAPGFVNRQITGVQITDRPIEPRLLFDRYIVDGDAPPQSEVELYLNNRLIDYQQANETGYYRFMVPLTYGNTDYQVRIYTPSGRSIERSRRIQIPFNYLPPGEVDYNVSFGRLDNPLVGSANQDYQAAATVGAGITNWLSVQGSSEYLTEYHSGSAPAFTGTVNARLFKQYLVSASANSESVFQLNSNVVFDTGANFNFNHTRYEQQNSIYNLAGIDQNTSLSVFTPLPIGLFPLNIRVTGNYIKDQGNDRFRYRTDLNSRLGRVNVRMGYSDQQVGTFSFGQTVQSRFFGSLTYSLRRSRDLPNFIRGAFLRGQISYLPGLEQFEETGIQISKDILTTGRLQFGLSRNFVGDFTALTLTMNIDFRNFRTNSSAVTGSGNYTINQGIQGSVVYDPFNSNVFLSNREQVGQSGLGVRLYVDNNNDGEYQSEDDELIRDQAVRLSFAGERSRVDDGIYYIGQLLPYFQYDVEINKAALKNPLLVPELDKFSIVTDPNQYKPLDIPFYQSGVISGQVTLKEERGERGLGGVRIFLQPQDSNSTAALQEIPTFSDGSFYTYEVPPGNYDMYIDPEQLRFLNAVSRPDTLSLTVEALAEGDFIEGLQFDLYKTGTEPTKDDSLITQNTEEDIKQVDYMQGNRSIDSTFVDPSVSSGIMPLNPLPAYYLPDTRSESDFPAVSAEEEYFLNEIYFGLSEFILFQMNDYKLELPDPISLPADSSENIEIQVPPSPADSTITEDPEAESDIETEGAEADTGFPVNFPALFNPPVPVIADTGDPIIAEEEEAAADSMETDLSEEPETETPETESEPELVIPTDYPFPLISVADTANASPADATEEERLQLAANGFPVPVDTISVGPSELAPKELMDEEIDDWNRGQPNVDLIQMPPPRIYYASAADELFLNNSTDSLQIDPDTYAVVILKNQRNTDLSIRRSPDELLSFRMKADSLIRAREEETGTAPEPSSVFPGITAPESESLPFTILEAGECTYRLQFSSTRSLKRAADLLSDISSDERYVIFNERAKLYGIRGGQFFSLSEAGDQAGAYSGPLFSDASVLLQCHEERDAEIPEFASGFLLVTGFPYTDLYDARTASVRLNDEYNGLNTFVSQLSENDYVVTIGSYDTEGEANRSMNSLSGRNNPGDLRVITAPALPIRASLAFSYELQVYQSQNIEELSSPGSDLEEQLGISSKIIRDESGRYLLVTDEGIQTWKRLLQLRESISDLGFGQPVIHLREEIRE